MHSHLEEINDLYKEVEDYISPPPMLLEKLTLDERLQFVTKVKESEGKYKDAVSKFKMFVPNLSAAEIIEGYKEGGRLLKHSLGGYMYLHFVDEYIPIMIQAIQADDDAAYLFLQVLLKRLGKDSAEFAVKALQSKSAQTTQAGISVIYELDLVEAIPHLESLVGNADVETIEVVNRVLSHLQRPR